MSVICVKNLSKNYNLYPSKTDRLKEAFSLSGKKYHKDFCALNDVSFLVEKGECVGIIGVNGSGKSTLLKILTGILTQTKGTIEINGTVSALLELGAGFNPDYTGLENIYLNGMIMGYNEQEIDKKKDAILEFADIGDFIYQPVKLYSSGMFVRLAFAIAINIEPDILIIDEALSVGDVFFQQKCYQKIRELKGKATVLIVSHDMNAMTKFCKRILVMHHGNLIFDGDPQEAVTKYFKVKQGEFKEDIKVFDTKKLKVTLDNYKEVEKNKLSGNMNVIITRYRYTLNEQEYAEVCSQGDIIYISMLVEAKITVDDLIVGYQVRDKYGNEVFGQTSLTSPVEQQSLSKGKSLISFEIVWPEIREGDYFITLGVGNGMDVLNQVEECWINNAIHLVATTYGKTIFGIFNQDMAIFHIKQLN